LEAVQKPGQVNKVCIVIPTYKERENLQRLIPTIQEVFSSHELANSATILIVDDNSPDGTGQLAEEMAKRYGNIYVLHRAAKMGLGSAYKEGFTYALQKLNSDTVFQMDADLSHDPKHLPEFLAKLSEGYQIVVGSRKVPGGQTIERSLYRRLTSSVANQLARHLCGIKVHDSTSGYRAFTKGALQEVEYPSIKASGYAFQVEMLFKCQRKGLKIAEIPIVFTDRKMEETKLNRSEILNFLSICFRLFLCRIRATV
jgi:dolichol-phosphate mannosyltransferase